MHKLSVLTSLRFMGYGAVEAESRGTVAVEALFQDVAGWPLNWQIRPSDDAQK